MFDHQGVGALVDLMGQIKITNKGVQQALAKYDHRKALAEYIWNGFDAGASLVEVLYQDTEISQIRELIIKDNGKGIPHNQLQDKFGPFYEFEKLHDANQKRLTSTYKGKNGVGRLTFFRFAAQATWRTCFTQGKQNYEYGISIKMGKLETVPSTYFQLR